MSRRPDPLVPVFAALGDGHRLRLIGKLGLGRRSSIAQLAEGSPLTRQAITKHLRVLEHAGLVRGERLGRETLFELTPRPMAAARAYLEQVAQEWEDALHRLQAFVEKEPGPPRK